MAYVHYIDQHAMIRSSKVKMASGGINVINKHIPIRSPGSEWPLKR
jgi:hypothetical protein